MVAVAAAVAKGGAHIQGTPGGPLANVPNTEAIGRVLYTDYAYFFQAAGLILLTAMIGAIVLTLRHRPGVKRQVVADQTARTTLTGMEIVKVNVGEGIDL